MVSWIFGIVDHEDTNQEDDYIIAFFAIHIAYVLIVVYLTIGIKIKDSIKQNVLVRILAI
jgi:hypothetical protein